MRNTKPMNAGKWMTACFPLCIGLALAACSDEKPEATGDTGAAVVSKNNAEQQAATVQGSTVSTAKGPSWTETSKNGLYQITIQSDEAPLPLNQIHSWTAHITTPEGRVVDEAIVMVYGGMPEHKHGFPSKPEVTGNLGNGRYRIDGVKFNMPGRWEMWINVRAFGKDDKAIFGFDVP